MDITKLPSEAFTYIVALRREAGRYRLELRNSEAALAASEIENEALRLELGR